MDVNAILVKPLDGLAPGSPRVFSEVDFNRLKAMGAVRRATDKDPAPDVADVDAALLERFRHPTDGPLLLAEMKGRFEAGEKERGEMADLIATMRKDADASNTRHQTIESDLQASRADLDSAGVRIAELEKELASAANAADEPEKQEVGTGGEKMLTPPANKMTAPSATKRTAG